MPDMPEFAAINDTYRAGDKVTFECSGNTGKPGGTLNILLKRVEDKDFKRSWHTIIGVGHMNKDMTVFKSRTLTMTLTEADNGIIIRCQAVTYGAGRDSYKPFTDITFEVLRKYRFCFTLTNYHS